MRKIVFAFSPYVLNSDTLTFSAYLAQLTHSSVVGVMLENPKTTSTIPVSAGHGRTQDHVDKRAPAPSRTHIAMVQEKLNTFRNYFSEKCIDCQVHEVRAEALDMLMKETRYADVLVLDAELTLTEHPKATPTDFAKRVLQEAECPVFIAPLGFEGVEEIVLTYNGSASSMYAIRQFANLLPELGNRKVTVLQVRTTDEDTGQDIGKLKEWLNTRYTDIHFENLSGTADAGLLGFILKKRKTITVMGAYGRSQVSQLLKPSAANILVKTIPQPLFIAHC